MMDHEIPERLELFPPAHVKEVSQLLLQVVMPETRLENIAPRIKFTVGPVITLFQLFGGQTDGLVNNGAGVILASIMRYYTTLALHLLEETCARVGRQDVERCRGDTMLNAPVHRPAEHVPVIVVKTENKAAVNHNAKTLQPFHRRRIIL